MLAGAVGRLARRIEVAGVTCISEGIQMPKADQLHMDFQALKGASIRHTVPSPQ